MGYNRLIEDLDILFLYHSRLSREIPMMQHCRRCPSLVFVWCCLLGSCIIIFEVTIFLLGFSQPTKRKISFGVYLLWFPRLCFGHMLNMGCFAQYIIPKTTNFLVRRIWAVYKKMHIFTKKSCFFEIFWSTLVLFAPNHIHWPWCENAPKLYKKHSPEFPKVTMFLIGTN